MFKVYVKGSYVGEYKTESEAMGKVASAARKYGYPWKVLDKYGKIFAQG